MEYDFSKSDECIKWLNYKYIVLGRSLYSFLLGVEKCKDIISKSDVCDLHIRNIIDRLQVLYIMISGQVFDDQPAQDMGLSVLDLFEKNKLGIMTTNSPVESYGKPILSEREDFQPAGYPYPFSFWFHEKTSYLAGSFVYVTCYLYDNNRSMFGTSWVDCIKKSTMEC